MKITMQEFIEGKPRKNRRNDQAYSFMSCMNKLAKRHNEEPTVVTFRKVKEIEIFLN